MATTKQAQKTKTQKENAATAPVEMETMGAVEQTVEKEEPKKAVKEQPKAVEKEVPKMVDESQYVTVKNGFHGKLVFISPRTGEKFYWDNYGDEQDIELRDLKGAKASAKAFLEKNWFLLDEWVIRYLGVDSYYRHAITPGDCDKLFRLPVRDLKTEIDAMNDSQRSSVIVRARELIKSGDLDSLRVITALEKALGVELIAK